MFEDVGSSIKSAAKTICALGMITAVILGVIRIAEAVDTPRLSDDQEGVEVFLGFLTMIVGSVVSWLISILFYGIGQLVENSDTLVAMAKDQEKAKAKAAAVTPAAPVEAPIPVTPIDDAETHDPSVAVRIFKNNSGRIFCPMCGTEQNDNRLCCQHCGTRFINQ